MTFHIDNSRGGGFPLQCAKNDGFSDMFNQLESCTENGRPDQYETLGQYSVAMAALTTYRRSQGQ